MADRNKGRRRKTSDFEKSRRFLVFILSHYKMHPVQTDAAVRYGVSQPAISGWIKIGTRLLEIALGENFLPSKRGCDLKKCIIKFMESPSNSECAKNEPVIIDSTERRTPRPVDNETQKIYYIGKAHCHTLKSFSVVLDRHSQRLRGRQEVKVAKEQNLKFIKVTEILGDIGFPGFTVDGAEVVLPHKKPKGKPLPEEHVISNQGLSRKRVFVERAIGRKKRMHIAKNPKTL